MKFFFLSVVAAIYLFIPNSSFCGGVLHVFPPTLREEAFAVARPTVLHSRTLITVSESSIEYEIDQTFLNNNDLAIEGVFLFPLPKGIRPAHGEARVDGLSIPLNVFPAESFFPLLKNWTEVANDASLLELAGNDVLVIRPVLMTVHQQKSFRLRFTQPRSIENDVLELLVPLVGERYSLGPVGTLELLVRLKMSRTVRSVFSATHHLEVLREAPHRCLVTARSEQKPVRDDFHLLATFSGEDIGLRIFAEQPAGERGTFAAFIEPPVTSPGLEEPERDIVFLLDRSGSIGNANLELARRAITVGLERLRPGDRFNVVTIGSRAQKLAGQLMESTSDNIAKAIRFVNSRFSEGGTDFYNALMVSLEQFPSRKRHSIVVLVGDGRSTIGVSDPETIIEDAKRNNRAKARICALALGEGADIALLDKMAASSKGNISHLSRGEDFQTVMSKFFAGISPPQVSEASLHFQNFSAEDVTPKVIPDMSGQEASIVLGRFKEKENVSATARLRAKVGGRIRTVTQSLSFPITESRGAYLQTLWAMRQVAEYLEDELLKRAQPKGRDQMMTLAREFGLKLPLAMESDVAAHPLDLVRRDSAELLWRFKKSTVINELMSDSYRRFGGMLFRLDKGVWVDTRYDPSAPVRRLVFLSEKYFEMLRQAPELGAYFSLGPEIIVALEDGAIRVTRDLKLTR